MVFFLAVLLATVPAWSSTPGHINPAGSGKSLTTDLNTTADYIFKTEIILARGGGGGNGGGNGGQGGNGGGNGGQGGNGGGNGGQGGNGYGDGVRAVTATESVTVTVTAVPAPGAARPGCRSGPGRRRR